MQFGPVAIDGISKGALKKKLDDRLAEAAQKLADYVTQGGIDLTKGATAEVTLKIKMKHIESGMVTVRGDVTDKAPTVPLPATDRLVLSEENGEVRLWMPLAQELTKDDDPRQMTFASQKAEKKDLGS